MSSNKEKPENEVRRTAPWLKFDPLTVVAVVAAVVALAISLANQQRVKRVEESIAGRQVSNGASTSLADTSDRTADLSAAVPPIEENQLENGFEPPGESLLTEPGSDASEFVGIRPVPSRTPDPNSTYAIRLDGAPIRGAADAPVTIVEFSDFQCPFCKRAKPTMARIQEVYGDLVRIVWKHLPLSMHQDAPRAHVASVAAANQGLFWEFHDKVFENQGYLKPDALRQYAREVGLSMERFEQDIASPEARQVVQADMDEAVSMDLTASPGFFINGRNVIGAKPFEVFASMINAELESLGLPVPEAARVE